MSTPVVHIVAMGARTPVGLRAESTAAAICARISRVREHSFLVDLHGQPLKAAYDGLLDPAAVGAHRMLVLGRSALDEVVDKLGYNAKALGAVPVVFGLPEPRAGFSRDEASWLADELGRTFGGNAPATQISFVMDGHAAALHALHSAARDIAFGRSDLCIVGGIESYLHPDTLLELDAEGRLAGGTVRSGMTPGEGACFLALASARARASLKMPSLARVVGTSSARDQTHAHGDEAFGEVLAKVLLAAASEHARDLVAMDDIYCDLNGERDRTDEWGFALLRTRELWRDPAAYTSFAAECGDLGAAGGGMLTILAVWTGLRRRAAGPNAMIWSSSRGGLRAAVHVNRGGG